MYITALSIPLGISHVSAGLHRPIIDFPSQSKAFCDGSLRALAVSLLART